MTHPTGTIQISPKSQPSTPTFLGEVAVFAQVLTHENILKAIAEEMLFARARFGHYDVIDFVAVLIGYAVSGEPCLGYFAYLFQNLEINDHVGNLIIICLMHEWRRKGADNVIIDALVGTDVSSSQHRDGELLFSTQLQHFPARHQDFQFKTGL